MSGSAPQANRNGVDNIRRFLQGDNALVTGGTSGIGAEVVRRLALAGAHVAVVGRDLDRLGSVRQLGRTSRSKVHAIQADLTDETIYSTIADRVAGLFGRLDIVVHAAGVFLPGPFLETTPEDLRTTLVVNLIAPFRLTQALLPQLRSGSSVIFVSSVAGHVGMTREAAYSASKAAVEGLTRALAVELAPQGIRVNAVAPGFTATPMNAAFRMKDSIVTGAEQATLARRLGRPEDIAKAVLFLASPEAAFIWGAVLPVDGGYPISTVQLGREW